MSMTLARIYRYPVKSLSASSLTQATLAAGQGVPDDRRFAIMHGASAFKPLEPEWQPKSNFAVLSRIDRLAALETDYDPVTTTLIIRRSGRQVARGQIGTPLGRGLIDQFLAAYLKGVLPGTPRLVEAAGVVFSDKQERLISIVNAASVADLERVVKESVDPLRFRPNLVIEGVAPWEETGWVGRVLEIGDARLEVTEVTTRCAAINVEPGTGAQSLNLLMALERGYNHRQCGIYARVIAGGAIRVGDTLTLPAN